MKRMWSKNELKQQNNTNAIELLGSGQVPFIKGDEILENMTGYSVEMGESSEKTTLEPIYVSVAKTGNKITFVYSGNITKIDDEQITLINFNIPEQVGEKLIPINIGGYDYLVLNKTKGVSQSFQYADAEYYFTKSSNTKIVLVLNNAALSSVKTYLRIEATFLLSDNLIPQP